MVYWIKIYLSDCNPTVLKITIKMSVIAPCLEWLQMILDKTLMLNNPPSLEQVGHL